MLLDRPDADHPDVVRARLEHELALRLEVLPKAMADLERRLRKSRAEGSDSCRVPHTTLAVLLDGTQAALQALRAALGPTRSG